MCLPFVPEVFAPKSQDLQRALVLQDLRNGDVLTTQYHLPAGCTTFELFWGIRTGFFVFSWDPFEGDQTMQMYGDFKGCVVVNNREIVWVGNISMSPVGIGTKYEQALYHGNLRAPPLCHPPQEIRPY